VFKSMHNAAAAAAAAQCDTMSSVQGEVTFTCSTTHFELHDKLDTSDAAECMADDVRHGLI
jgi:hypothetical protein